MLLECSNTMKISSTSEMNIKEQEFSQSHHINVNQWKPDKSKELRFASSSAGTINFQWRLSFKTSFTVVYD